MSIKRLSFIIIFCFVFAGAYFVQRGDTLWDLSDRFFNDPFSWVDIWAANKESLEYLNKHIDKDNPNPISIVWIYPGDSLCIPGEEECPRAGSGKQIQRQARNDDYDDDYVNDVNDLNKLSKPKAAKVSSQGVESSGFGAKEAPKIFNSYYQRLMPILEPSDKSKKNWHAVFSDEPKKPIFYSVEHEIVLDFGRRKYPKLKANDLAEVWHFEKVSIPSESGVEFTDYILSRLAAIAKITAVGDSLSRAVIVQSFSSLKMSNARARLPVPIPTIEVNGFKQVKQAKVSDMAKVLLVLDKSLLVSSYSYVVIDEGKKDKYEPGMAVALWDIDARDKTLPPRLLGRGLVVYSNSNFSTVLLRELYSASRSIEAGVPVSITHIPIK